MRFTMVFFAGASLFLAGCGSGGTPEGKPSASHPVAAPSTSLPGPVGEVPSAYPSGEAVLSDPQERPDGLAEQFSMPGLGEGFPCPASGSLRVWAAPETLSGAEPDSIDVSTPMRLESPLLVGMCVGGVPSGTAATVTLIDPSGRVLRQETRDSLPDSGDTVKVAFEFPPEGEGLYTVKAEAGGRAVSRKALVTPASKVKVTVLNMGLGTFTVDRRAIRRLKVAFGGLPPGRETAFHLYHGKSGTGSTLLDYHATYRVRGGARGGALLDLAIAPEAPSGYYSLTWESADQSTDHPIWDLS